MSICGGDPISVKPKLRRVMFVMKTQTVFLEIAKDFGEVTANRCPQCSPVQSRSVIYVCLFDRQEQCRKASTLYFLRLDASKPYRQLK